MNQFVNRERITILVLALNGEVILQVKWPKEDRPRNIHFLANEIPELCKHLLEAMKHADALPEETSTQGQ